MKKKFWGKTEFRTKFSDVASIPFFLTREFPEYNFEVITIVSRDKNTESSSKNHTKISKDLIANFRDKKEQLQILRFECQKERNNYYFLKNLITNIFKNNTKIIIIQLFFVI